MSTDVITLTAVLSAIYTHSLPERSLRNRLNLTLVEINTLYRLSLKVRTPVLNTGSSINSINYKVRTTYYSIGSRFKKSIGRSIYS